MCDDQVAILLVVFCSVSMVELHACWLPVGCRTGALQGQADETECTGQGRGKKRLCTITRCRQDLNLTSGIGTTSDRRAGDDPRSPRRAWVRGWGRAQADGSTSEGQGALRCGQSAPRHRAESGRRAKGRKRTHDEPSGN